jgi:hypothetical protein
MVYLLLIMFFVSEMGDSSVDNPVVCINGV